jgi:hypothetical protein
MLVVWHHFPANLALLAPKKRKCNPLYDAGEEAIGDIVKNLVLALMLRWIWRSKEKLRV